MLPVVNSFVVAAVLSHLYFTNLIDSSTTRSFWPQLQQIPAPQKYGYANVNLQSLSPFAPRASAPHQVPGAGGVAGEAVARRSAGACMVWLEGIAFSRDIADRPGLLQFKQTGFGQRLSVGEM